MENVILGKYVKIKTGKLDVNASAINGKYPFFTCAREISRINEFAFDCEAVLVAGNGELNVKYYEGKFNAYQRTYVIESIDKSVLSVKYLFYFLDSYIEKLRNGAIGGVIKYIKLGHLTDIEFPLPDLETQNKIVAILDKAKAILDKREETIKKYDELLRATFLEMFGDPVKNEKGWEEKKIKDVAKVRIGPFGSLLHQEDYIPNGIPIVNPSHIINGKIIIDSNLTVSNQKLEELLAYVMLEDDVVLGRRGEIGRCAVVTENENGYLCGTGSIFIRPTDKLNAYYLYRLISSTSIKDILENLAKGVTMKNLNSSIVENLMIPIPPISHQQKFYDILRKIELTTNKLNNSKKHIENLIGGLSQQAFKGELDFNTAVDLEVLLENDFEFFKENSNIKSIQLLIDRLNTDELNENRFYEQQTYDKAKSFVFELIKEGKVKQVFDEKTKKVKLTI